jgi:hypothetical protein
LARIIEGQSVVAANGKRYKNKFILVAKQGTARRPGSRDPKRLRVNRHAVGAIWYFDERTLEPRFYKAPGAKETAQKTQVGPAPDRVTPPRRPYNAKTLGQILKQPERELVRRYVAWLGAKDRFEHRYLSGPRLYTDLLIQPNWTLIEAKSSIDRWAIRLAIGQLFDYQRYFPRHRHPQLAVLLPERPSPTMIKLLKSKRIAAIWSTPAGGFRDSKSSLLTGRLRVR